jgi:hypothetical protein
VKRLNNGVSLGNHFFPDTASYQLLKGFYMKITFNRSIGFILLSIYLILVGLIVVIPGLNIPAIALGIIALASGICILLGL